MHLNREMVEGVAEFVDVEFESCAVSAAHSYLIEVGQLVIPRE